MNSIKLYLFYLSHTRLLDLDGKDSYNKKRKKIVIYSLSSARIFLSAKKKSQRADAGERANSSTRDRQAGARTQISQKASNKNFRINTE